ncbi:MAG: thioredoxin family protein [Candidatus Kariarchaeaceae archaeon]|jgi:hypothetical protein
MVQLQKNQITSNSTDYQEYLTTMPEDQRNNWKEYHNKIKLDSNLETLLKSPALPINIIVFSGSWCPECALAGSILDKMATVSSFITLHFIDREGIPTVYENFMPNGDKRVPVILFTSEDFFIVTMWMERSSKKYELLWKVIQKTKSLAKQEVFDELAKTYKENENLIVQSTIDEITAELIRTIGTVNYSTRLNTAL